jgi:hypothetical protein
MKYDVDFLIRGHINVVIFNFIQFNNNKMIHIQACEVEATLNTGFWNKLSQESYL